jgi:F420-dependent oxidoreductase-like protein
MLKIALMVEGQMGLNWNRWKRITTTAEDLGFAGLYRSDHYTNPEPPDMDSLELWISLTWLASHTSKIEFGPLVSPVSFRDPTMTARMAGSVDDLSGGRLVLGLGAGWQEREHRNFGWQLGNMQERFARFEEGLTVITKLLQNNQPITYSGRYYNLNDAILLPRPYRPGGPPILIGGNGPNKTLPLVVKFANEWNGVYIPPVKYASINALLNDLLLEAGREPEDVKRSLMTNLVFGRTDQEVNRLLQVGVFGITSKTELQENGIIVGTASEVIDQIGEFANAGVEKIMLQWLDLEAIDRLKGFAQNVLEKHHC